jgi:hypothetical protein
MDDALKLLKETNTGHIIEMKMIPITEIEIISIIKSPKNKNSTGCVEVRSKILKYCAFEISKPFSYICNFVKIWHLS